MCLDTVTTLPRPVGVARAITTFTGIPVFYRLGHSNVASNSRRAMRTVLGSTCILFSGLFQFDVSMPTRYISRDEISEYTSIAFISSAYKD
jgi:hypothetical protein